MAAQYCGALGKTANCQVAPSVHLVTDAASCPVNWRLFLPEQWDPETAEEPQNAVLRRRRARIPDDVGHVAKWRLAVDMVDELRCWGLDPPPVVADEGYGQDGAFRLALEERGITYVVGVRSDTAILPETAERTAPPWSGTGRKPVPRYRDPPVAVRDLVVDAGRGALHRVTWRQGSKGPLHSRFAALRVRPAAGGSGRPTQARTCRCAGCWPSGPPASSGRRSTGCPRCPPTPRCGAWCARRRSAGGSSTTTAS
ncbi:IS701 family transposase [Streptomyces prasinus]